MGFIDLSGSLGRHFGSIGVALNEISTRLSVTRAEQFAITGPAAQRAEKCMSKLCEALHVPDKLSITIETAIPEHVGLGSGTQMSLAIGAALNEFYGLGLSVREIAAVADRGLRSGIGIGVFEQGGLVVDGGRGEKTITPPVLAHMDVPDEWRFILVFDERGQGLHGQQEIQAFEELPPFPRQEAARLCYLLLMQGLPAVAENDIVSFGDVITQLQRSVGEHFSSAQGGVFTSPEVAAAMQWLERQGAVGIGQTSWGPTGFCAIDGVQLAETIADQARQEFAHFDKLSFVVASARNSGGEVFVG
ncbi:MAG: GHMP kinase [Methylobacter sp.]|nr:beta-ribofuranosylaminobenzene 5'-phosphate synthase family protein [Methylobacter sp.]MCK9620840.1 GHMP kinase [Methylobacter sp.]